MIINDNGEKISIISIIFISCLFFFPPIFSFLDKYNLNYKYLFMITLLIIIGIFLCKNYKLKFILLDNGIEVKRIFFRSIKYNFCEIINYYDPIIATKNNEFKLTKRDIKFKKSFEAKYEEYVQKNNIYYKDTRKILVETNELKEKNKNNNTLIFNILCLTVMVLNFTNINFISKLKYIIFLILIIVFIIIFMFRVYKNRVINKEIKIKKLELKIKIGNMLKAYCA